MACPLPNSISARAAVKAVARWRCVAALIVVVAVQCLSGDAASASCGDYLLQRGLAAAQVEAPSVATKPVWMVGEHYQGETPITPVKPCNGLGCSSFPDRPAVPASPVTVKDRLDHAIANLCESAGDERKTFLPVASSDAAPRIIPTEIFRPPRGV